MDSRATRAEISTLALKNNISAIKRLIGASKLCIVLKANAYGHGLGAFALLTQPWADSFAVATVNEGVKLRDSGVTAPILVLSPHLQEEIPALIRYKLTPLISHGEYIAAYAEAAQKEGLPLNLHLKIDTGMGRMGVRPEGALSLAKKISASPYLKIGGLCTHFANADEIEGAESVRLQFEIFNTVKQNLASEGIIPPFIHTANTGATLLHPQTHCDMVRVGLGVYGYFEAQKSPLTPILSLKSKVMLSKTIKAGDKVSYGHTWTAKKDTQIGIVPAGYGDGYSRLLSNRGQVLIEGKLYPIIGRVCMDQTIVDITGLHKPLEKDVLLYGDHPVLNASTLAKTAGLSSYEVLTTLAERVPRIYKDN